MPVRQETSCLLVPASSCDIAQGTYLRQFPHLNVDTGKTSFSLLVPRVAKDLKFMDQENVSSYRIAEN